MGWLASLGRRTDGSALAEFSVALPLLVVFVVGIYDFSGAFNEKQKIEQAAQEGAILAASQPMTDIVPPGSATISQPESLEAVVTAIVNSLASSGVLPTGNQVPCKPPFSATGHTTLTWTYSISGCAGAASTDPLVITINRGFVSAPVTLGSTVIVATVVGVSYPYHWRFNSVIQLLFPGSGPGGYAATTSLSESAMVHNQM